MSTLDNQQAWIPIDDSRDCSIGICTIYCPQWCYFLISPPPSFSLTTNFNNHITTFSPLLIAIIISLAAFFLFITYYSLINKFNTCFCFHRNNFHNQSTPSTNFEEDNNSENYQQENWHLPPSKGLDEEFIKKITVCRYRRGEGLVEGTECSVCLSEFKDGENLRLLPKCSHAFHLQCIDTWLKSHSSCPLCRVNILLPSVVFEEGNWEENRDENEQDDVVIVVGDLDLERIGEDRNMEKDFVVKKRAKDRHRFVSVGSLRRGKEKCVWGLHSVISPVRMKRSVWSRSWFARQGKGRVLFLPVLRKEI